MSAVAHATAKQAEAQTQAQEPVAKTPLYRIAATRLANNAQLLMYGAVAITAIANLPMASANCEAAERLCVAGCMSWGGPDPRETGACLIGCKLAYWACKAGAAYFGIPG